MTSKDETRRARPVPPTRLTLNRDYIATVALSLIDDIGLDKFSMRKLGTELGVDPMAVYRYFTDQETLFDGVAEALFEELDVESLPWQGTWRQLCEQFCNRMRSTARLPIHTPSPCSRPVRCAQPQPSMSATG